MNGYKPISASIRNFPVDTQDGALCFPARLDGCYSWLRAQMDPIDGAAWGGAVVIVEGRLWPDQAKWYEIDATKRFTTGTAGIIGPINIAGYSEARLKVSTVSGTAGLRYAAYLLAVPLLIPVTA